NNNDRLRNSSAVTLSGGTLELIGNSAGTSETVGSMTISSDFYSILASTSTGAGPTALAAAQLVRNANSFVEFRGFGSDLGSAANQIRFFASPIAQLVNGILPFATVAKANDLD